MAARLRERRARARAPRRGATVAAVRGAADRRRRAVDARARYPGRAGVRPMVACGLSRRGDVPARLDRRPPVRVAKTTSVLEDHLQQQRLVKKLLSGCTRKIRQPDVHPSGDHVLSDNHRADVDLDRARVRRESSSSTCEALHSAVACHHATRLSTCSDDGTTRVFHATMRLDATCCASRSSCPSRSCAATGVRDDVGVFPNHACINLHGWRRRRDPPLPRRSDRHRVADR